MTFRNENTATAVADNAQAGRKRARLRMAMMGGALAALPVAGLVAATSASAAPVSTWEKVAQCESTGNWSINTGNGFSGGLQFTPSTWAAYGGTQYAASAYQATEAQQISVAEKVLASQGPGAWPVCSVKAGLTAGGAAASVNTNTGSASSSTSNTAATSTTSATSTKSTLSTTSTKAAPSTDSARSTQQTVKQSAKPAAKSATTGGSYTVKSGDTLSAIAAAHGVSTASLYNHNTQVIGGNADMILPGQVLSV